MQSKNVKFLSTEMIVGHILEKNGKEAWYQKPVYHTLIGKLYNHLHDFRFTPSADEQNAILAREHGQEMGYEWQVSEGWHG